jgi:hypothetical protein
MAVRFIPLFVAKIRNGVIDYQSRQTGFHYKIYPDNDGFAVDSSDNQLNLWTAKRDDALRLVHMSDLASLAKERGACLRLIE